MSKFNAILTLICFASCGVIFTGAAVSAQAADMVSDSYYREPTVHGPKVKHTHRTAYRVVTQPYNECDLLRVSYYPPYARKTEIVEVCYKPVDLRPGKN